MGSVGGASASIVLIIRLFRTNPISLIFLAVLVVFALFGRPVLLRHVTTEGRRH